VAGEYLDRGYNAKALLGGVEAWKMAGHPVGPAK